MKTKTVVVAAWSAVMLTGCASSTGSPAAHNAPASPATATSTTVAQSPCVAIGGTVDPDQTCHLDSDNARFKADFQFPVDYPDQQALTDFLTQRRDAFVDWVADGPLARLLPYFTSLVRHSIRAHRLQEPKAWS
jgi:putative hemolysin